MRRCSKNFWNKLWAQWNKMTTYLTGLELHRGIAISLHYSSLLSEIKSQVLKHQTLKKKKQPKKLFFICILEILQSHFIPFLLSMIPPSWLVVIVYNNIKSAHKLSFIHSMAMHSHPIREKAKKTLFQGICDLWWRGI